MLSHGFQLGGMLQSYSSLPFNITSGVTTVQGTAGRPIVNGEFIERNAGIGSNFFTLNVRLSRAFRVARWRRAEGRCRGVQSHQSPERPAAQHELRFGGVSGSPLSTFRAGDGGWRAAFAAIRLQGEVLMARATITVNVGVGLALVAATACAPPAAEMPAALVDLSVERCAEPDAIAGGSKDIARYSSWTATVEDVMTCTCRGQRRRRRYILGSTAHRRLGGARVGECRAASSRGRLGRGHCRHLAVEDRRWISDTNVAIERRRAHVRRTSIRSLRRVDRDARMAGDRTRPSRAPCTPSGSMAVMPIPRRAATVIIPTQEPLIGRAPPAPRQDVYPPSSQADGSTAEAHVAHDVCFCCKTAVGIGPSGRVYVAWRHIFPESIRDIALAISEDAGRTFGSGGASEQRQLEAVGMSG